MELLFPHNEIRETQKELMDEILNALKSNKHILIHAPTGIGKTASAIAPALSYVLQEEKDLTIFFLTPKHTQHKIAVETLKLIKEKYKCSFNVVSFIGKKWMCAHSGVRDLSSSEFSEYCKDQIKRKTCDYFTNIKDSGKLSLKTKTILEEFNEKIVNIEEVINESSKRMLCPYEVSCLLGKEANVVIADYNHIISPNVRDILFKKINKSLDKAIIIFDEAHNLPERIRSLLTVNLSTVTLENAVKEVKSLGYEELANNLSSLIIVLEKFAQRMRIDERESLLSKSEFISDVSKIGDYEKLMADFIFVADQALEFKKKSFTLFVANFLEAWQGTDDGFTRILKKGFTKRGRPAITLTYRCLDPSIIMKDIASQARIIAVSGTFSPINMYKDLFGFETITKEYENPFPKKNRLNIIIPETTTKFTFRNTEMFKKIAERCASLVNLVPGNIALFFPSYNLRDEIYIYFKDLCNKTIFLEYPGLSKKERDDLIERFKGYSNSGAALLGASSGSLGEGVDLPGDFLKAVIIVGLPLSKPDLETKELIRYYDERFKKGWDYGYIYPAMIKCMQNAGRCIRSKNDKGIRIFLDERYSWHNYFKCFPRDWDMRITKMPEEKIKEFLGN